MADSVEGAFAIPHQFVYDGMVLQDNFFPKEVLDRIKTLELFPGDVLLSSALKNGR